ncbi:MAG TPA: nickel pincer cofactor biosynthesis protein LarC, partial [Gemmatimonadota bacterium]|nr:nickel pincer cofactor biosynthesis protein LarC [Gemmatimonadota bacterium]
MDARHAVFDPFAGIAGDMVLGAWIDLGLDREWLAGLADRLDLAFDRIEVERVDRAGLEAARVVLEPAAAVDGHGRHWAGIREQLEQAPLEEAARPLALATFERLARAEARVHGVPAEEVHFHEVGAVDAILDVCGAAEGFVRLGFGSASTRPVTLGGGTVVIQHGEYPVPAPATAYLLEGTAIRTDGYEGECTTPTGAAILAQLTGGRPPEGDLLVERVAYGAGTRDPGDHPNCLRVWAVGHPETDPGGLVVLQANVDDLSPEYAPELVEACLAAGALDATVHGIGMKKGRPGWRVEALVRPGAQPAVEEAIFEHSTTLGVRGWRAFRRAKARRIEAREWRGHRIRVKLSPAEAGKEGPSS